MNRLELFRVNLDYVKYLWSFDNRVQYNSDKPDFYNQNRPYVGIVLSINNFDYFVPLEHPRKAHKTLKSNCFLLKIMDGKYGLMAFNNMIPIDKAYLIDFDIEKEKPHYYNILLNQLNFCNDNKSTIKEKAENTYSKRTNSPNAFLKKNCCNFNILEEKAPLFRKS
ncbi:MAG: type III toxin-antitoxin system ToxN/AbiQ family toxin [Oscillospiraceae bacterium]